MNSALLSVNKKQEALFRVQERNNGCQLGFITDFSDIKNNDIKHVDSFPDLISLRVSRNDVKIRKQTYPGQGPLYEFAFTLPGNFSYDISVNVYQCPEDDFSVKKFSR